MLMFVVGFVAAILLNFFGWLLLAEVRDEPVASVPFGGRDFASEPGNPGFKHS